MSGAEPETSEPYDSHELAGYECLRLLATVRLGRIVFDDIDGPIVMPMNHVVDRGSIIVRTSAASRLALMANGARVAFEADDVDPRVAGTWSVLVSGRADFMTAEEVGELTVHPQPWASGVRSLFIRVTPRTITGRRLVAR